jgi:hypothetical protein
MSIIVALTIGVISLGIFQSIWRQKDGIARILLLIFFGSTGIWAISRGTILYLIKYNGLPARTGMNLIGDLHYLIYAPVIISAIYLIYKRK